MIYPAILPNPEKLWNDNRPDLAERKMRGLLEPARRATSPPRMKRSTRFSVS
jgi:hypothetical protein